MSTIHFDCLMPEAEAPKVLTQFQQLSTLLVHNGVAADLKVTHAVGSEVELRQAYPEADTDWQAHSFTLTAQDIHGSVNQLAMIYSRILTPPADLPNDPVVLQDQENFEIPPRYPWSVRVHA